MASTSREEPKTSQEANVDIEASPLGTKDYWDTRYETELKNFHESGDEGEIWFGKNAENRMIKYIMDNHKRDISILDLGCGNGSLLRRLRAKGYRSLAGFDYCDAAIDLATDASEEGEEDTGVEIQFRVFDILSEEDKLSLQYEYSLVLDKGTWDAMSLCEPDERDLRLQSYAETILRSTRNPSSDESDCPELLILSCNFTCAELQEQFEKFPFLKFKTEIPAASSFSFAGTSGVTSSGAVFRRLKYEM